MSYKVSAVKNDLNVNVSPLSGCLLAKETIELRVDLCPTTIGSFDIKVCVYVKESKSVYMRLTGTVEKPRVTIDKVCCYFTFHEEFCVAALLMI